MRKTGNFEQPITITLDISRIIEEIRYILYTLIEEYISQIADDVNIDNIEFEFDDDEIRISNISYKGVYTNTHFNQTYEDSAVDDYEFYPNEEEFTTKDMTKYINEHVPDWMKYMIKAKTINIDTNDVELSESEPDWDSMPGGHDDI